MIVFPPVILGVLLVVSSQDLSRTAEPVVLKEKGRQIHARALVIDGHNDLPWVVRTKGKSSFDVMDISQLLQDTHTDIPRLRKGGIGAQFWAAYVPADTLENGGKLKTAKPPKF